ncbi:MAG: amidohydrolase [Acidobacteria bacterium]|nr:MAG: amidohydrolase [Acidobacteriota bacterium]
MNGHPLRIDSHQHFWRYDAREYGWIDETMPPLRRDFLPGELKREMDAAGIDASVAVQARSTLEETRWLLALADAHPFIAGVVGWVDLQSPGVEAELERMAGHPRLVGVRHIVQAEPDDFLSRPAFRRGVAALSRFDLAYDILVYARQLHAAADFVAAFPRQRFVLDHLGKPDIRGDGFASWKNEFTALARFPNVCCKLSGLVTEARWDSWTPSQLRPYIDSALECYGPERLMIGSDWPVCTVAGSYQRTMGVVIDAVGALSAVERAEILGGAAQRFWNLSVTERAT